MENSKFDTNLETSNESLFNGMDPAILDDPIMMLKWFESHELTLEEPPQKTPEPILTSGKKARAHKPKQLIDQSEILPEDLLSLDSCFDQDSLAQSGHGFIKWLSEKVNENSKHDILEAIELIEKYARKYGLIQLSLFHVSDLTVIRQIQSLLVQKKDFRSLDLTLRYTCGLALRYYSQYLSEEESIDPTAVPPKEIQSEQISVNIVVNNSSNTKTKTDPQSNINERNTSILSSFAATSDADIPFLPEQISKQLQEIHDALLHHLKDIDKSGVPAIAEAYHAYLTEKLKKAPEQIISESIRNLLFIIRSVETYGTLSDYARYLSDQSNSLQGTSAPSENIAAISDNLLQQGITPGWLYMHGLSALEPTSDSSQLVDTSIFTYKKIKKGIRIDSVKTSGRIVIPDFIEGLPVIKIGESAFRRRKDITTVLLPKHLIEIEEYAFEKSGILSIIIPDSVEQIGQCAFRECKKLSEVTLPQMLKTIKWNTFYGCSAIKALKIPTNVATISDSAFSGCTKLKMVQIPDSVTRMENYIFSSSPVLYCNKGSRAFRYTEERWRWPKPKAYEDFDNDVPSASHKK